jgi:uncharacterized protein YndB with AHSA1/START domain
MTQDTTTEVRHEVVVDVDVERAFWTFVDLDRIKPREHNLLHVPIEATVVEHREGGDIYDRGTDGSTCRWARVLTWDPPHRFVFSWDIGPDWRIADDLAHTSEVDVSFTPEADGSGAEPTRTRVVLTHRHLERHGDAWTAVRDGVADKGGWPLYLTRFQEAVVAARPMS